MLVGVMCQARASPGGACVRAARVAAVQAGLPVGLLEAVGLVESGRVGRDGRRTPWPYAVNVDGAGVWPGDEAQAADVVRDALAGSARAVDVGCFQIDLEDHPGAFASLRAAFDPMSNADYAAGFLARLHARLGSWRAAVAAYHSATPARGGPYARLVQAAWQGRAGAVAAADPHVIRLGGEPVGLPRIVTP